MALECTIYKALGSWKGENIGQKVEGLARDELFMCVSMAVRAATNLVLTMAETATICSGYSNKLFLNRSPYDSMFVLQDIQS